MGLGAQVVWARLRITIECVECANPIPVNGITPSVLCHACNAVVALEGQLGWDVLTTYQSGEGCLEHGLIMSSEPRKAIDYYLALPDGAQRCLNRRYRGILLEVDDLPPRCAECRAPIEFAALTETVFRDQAPHAFCSSCGHRVPVRHAGDLERAMHSSVIAVVGESAPTGDLQEPDKGKGEAVLFACMGCGAPLKVDASAPRISTCEYCEATNYLPDALWLRLHPAQRKRPFHMLLDVRGDVILRAFKMVHH